jgi:hypothetical protein
MNTNNKAKENHEIEKPKMTVIKNIPQESVLNTFAESTVDTHSTEIGVIDRNVMMSLRSKIVGFAEQEAVSNGLVVNRISGEFTNDEAEINIQISTVVDINLDRYGKTYLMHAQSLGLEPVWLGMSFAHPTEKNKRYRLTGLVKRSNQDSGSNGYLVRLRGEKSNHQYEITSTLIGLLKKQDEDNKKKHTLETNYK